MIDKQHILSFALLLGSLLAVGCSSSDDELTGASAPITFGTLVTRAAVNADKTNMEDFLVWGGFDNENNLFNAESVTKDGSYTGTRYWVPGKEHNFYALHPAGLTVGTTDKVAQHVECNNNGVITVTDFNTSLKRGTDAIDLMTASITNITYNVGETPSSVDLTFSHELSRVKFTISTDAKVTITDVKLWGINFKGDFTTQADAATPWSKLTTADESNTPFSQPDDFELEANGKRHLLAGTYDADNDNYGDLLFIPQAITNEVIFTMSWTYADGSIRGVKVPLNQAGPDQWEKGKSYHYQATIPSPTTDITFTVKVTDWNDYRIDAVL